MKLSDNTKLRVESTIIRDLAEHECGEIVVSDERAEIVRAGDLYKCVFSDIADYKAYTRRVDLHGEVCLLGAPINAPQILGFSAEPCLSYAYLSPMPPPPDTSVAIKRLAPTLAGLVHDVYRNPAGAPVRHFAELMRKKGIFGAIVDNKLAGFIGLHDDGSIGMLEVLDGYRRRGIGLALERFIINYVMTFGRVPICDVFADNAASVAMQQKLGMTAANGYTFWFETA